MKIEIKNRWDGRPIYVTEGIASLSAAVLQAVATGIDLHCASLARADFSGASLSGARLALADLRGTRLVRTDLRGTNLSDADLSKADLRGADPRGANLRGADLSDADLSSADLRGADLHGADLHGADLRGATFGELDLHIPTVPQLDARVLAAITSEGGALDMKTWHTTSPNAPVCGSTHCRAGWAVHLAGEAGYALERLVGPSAAGALIYAKSTGRPVPDFLAKDEDALEDIKRCAGQL